MKQENLHGHDLYTIQEAAAYFRCSKACMDVWRSRRKGPVYTKIGGRVFYRKSDLDAYITDNIVRPSGK